MVERFTVETAGYVMYSDMIDRIHRNFPHVPRWRVEQIAAAENDAITGGLLTIVPAGVEAGVVELLERDVAHGDDESEGRDGGF